MRITEFSVTSLFGLFNHEVKLNTSDRITIIHGANGIGKTIVLKMLYGLFNETYDEFLDIPFDRFQVKLENGDVILVEKELCHHNKNTILPSSEEEERYNSYTSTGTRITIQLDQETSQQKNKFSLSDAFIKERRNHAAILMMELTRSLSKRDASTFIEKMNDAHFLGSDNAFVFNAQKIPLWWKELQNSVDVHLIEAQRLLSLRKEDLPLQRKAFIPVVEEYSQGLAETIQKKRAESADLSQELDRTFPVRLVEKKGRSELTDEALRDKLTTLEKKRSKLKEVGLLDKKEDIAFLPSDEFIGNTKDLLEVYVHDVEKKLSVFNDISDRISLFKEIINERFLYKKIHISKESGLYFTGLNNDPLPVSALSAGEQHELVLLYQLLFQAKQGSLILIDEPELSLHLAWQRYFLRDLQKVSNTASLDVILATHSPQIIHDRWDLTVELKGPAVL